MEENYLWSTPDITKVIRARGSIQENDKKFIQYLV